MENEKSDEAKLPEVSQDHSVVVAWDGDRLSIRSGCHRWACCFRSEIQAVWPCYWDSQWLEVETVQPLKVYGQFGQGCVLRFR